MIRVTLSRAMRTIAIPVALAWACSGCATPPASVDLGAARDLGPPDVQATDVAPDAAARDQAIDALPDISHAPDLPWVHCSATQYEPICALASGGQCCDGQHPYAYWCPPKSACVASDCFKPETKPCATDHYCRSMGGCGCVPSPGTCGGCSTCVASCTPLPACPKP